MCHTSFAQQSKIRHEAAYDFIDNFIDHQRCRAVAIKIKCLTYSQQRPAGKASGNCSHVHSLAMAHHGC